MEGKKELKKEEIIKLFVIIFVIILMLIYLIANRNNKKTFVIDKNDIDTEELISVISDNYTLDVKKTLNDKEDNIEFITDGVLKLFNKNDEKNGYLIYNGKTYYVESNKTTIKGVNTNPEYLEDDFYNMDFIKSIVKLCNIENAKRNSFDCNIKIKDYIDNYNLFFNKSFSYDEDDNIIFNIKYKSIINKISVDYTKINEIINNGGSLKYVIKIKNVNSNDYSDLLKVFEKELKK